MNKHAIEWLRQADYDMDTAEFMFGGQRFFYAVFMCHLAIEKALKSLYQQKENKVPPKTHDLLYFVEKLNLQIPQQLYDFIKDLSTASVPTRYPDTLEEIMKKIKKADVERDISLGKETLQWIKNELSK